MPRAAGWQAAGGEAGAGSVRFRKWQQGGPERGAEAGGAAAHMCKGQEVSPCRGRRTTERCLHQQERSAGPGKPGKHQFLV